MGTPWAIKVRPTPKDVFFLAAVVINRVMILSILVSNEVCPLVLNCVCFLQEATFSSLFIRPSAKKDLHKAFNIVLN